MLLSISGVQYLSTFDLFDNRFRGIYEIYATAVLAGLDELARMLIGDYINIWSLVPDIIVYTID